MRLVRYAIFPVVVLVAALGIDLAKDRWFKVPPAPQAQFAPAPQIPAAENVKIVTVPGPTRIVTRDKVKIVHDLKLPDEIAKNPDKEVTATAQVIAPDKSKIDAVAVEDVKTGVTEIETKIEKPPFFSFLNEKEIGMRGGITLNGAQGVVYARWTFLRTGNVHYALYTEGSTPPFMGPPVIASTAAPRGDAKIMLDISYRW